MFYLNQTIFYVQHTANSNRENCIYLKFLLFIEFSFTPADKFFDKNTLFTYSCLFNEVEGKIKFSFIMKALLS